MARVASTRRFELLDAKRRRGVGLDSGRGGSASIKVNLPVERLRGAARMAPLSARAAATRPLGFGPEVTTDAMPADRP